MLKKAFTLAEILITMSILGVVAFLTIPTLGSEVNEKETISKVKKMFNTLSTAIMQASVENGDIIKWDYSETQSSDSAKEFASYIKPYLKIVKDCGTDSQECYTNEGISYLNGNISSNVNTNDIYYKMILSDGSLLFFKTLDGKCEVYSPSISNVCAVFYYDVNGKKKPNTIGKDIFTYYALKNKVITSPSDCDKTSDGWGCSDYIMQNDNMDYLKD